MMGNESGISMEPQRIPGKNKQPFLTKLARSSSGAAGHKRGFVFYHVNGVFVDSKWRFNADQQRWSPPVTVVRADGLALSNSLRLT